MLQPEQQNPVKIVVRNSNHSQHSKHKGSYNLSPLDSRESSREKQSSIQRSPNSKA